VAANKRVWCAVYEGMCLFVARKFVCSTEARRGEKEQEENCQSSVQFTAFAEERRNSGLNV